MDTSRNLIYFFTANINVWAPILALIIALIRARRFGRFSAAELATQFFRQLLFWVVGISSLYVFFIYVWAPSNPSAHIFGWTSAQINQGLAAVNLSFGALGLMALISSLGFQTATAIGYAVWVFIDGVGHFIKHRLSNPDPTNIGFVMLTDLIVPIIIILLVMVVHQNKKSKR